VAWDASETSLSFLCRFATVHELLPFSTKKIGLQEPLLAHTAARPRTQKNARGAQKNEKNIKTNR
jgi:hypothetical protein